MRKFKLLLLLSGSLALISCGGGHTALPKPRLYPRVVLPEGGPIVFKESQCAFEFFRPSYTKIQFEPEVTVTGDRHHPCWFDLNYPDLNCSVHFSYYPISEENSLEKLSNDAYRMTNEHNKKATYIEELQVNNPKGVHGILFDLEGPVATPFQFFLTDSVNHFLRGALYFKTQIRPDSLAPYYEFVKQDLAQMINTFEWSD